MMPYCTSYLKSLSAWFWDVPEHNKDFAITTYGGGGHLSKTAEQNFMKLSGIVHYMLPYSTSYLSFYSNDFGVSQSKTRTLPCKTWGSKGYNFLSIVHRISSFKAALTKIFITKILKICVCVWKKTLICHKICNIKANTTYFKNISFGMQPNIYYYNHSQLIRSAGSRQIDRHKSPDQIGSQSSWKRTLRLNNLSIWTVCSIIFFMNQVKYDWICEGTSKER